MKHKSIIDEKLLDILGDAISYKTKTIFISKTLPRLKAIIKQIVKSVPMEKIEIPRQLNDGGEWGKGYNQHVKEIKQWETKILKELKEEK